MERVYSGMPRFNWAMNDALASQWNGMSSIPSKVYQTRAYRISEETLKATKNMAFVLTEVEFKHGVPVLTEDDSDYLVMAGMLVENVLCRVVYSQRPDKYYGEYVVIFDNRNKPDQPSAMSGYQTIEAAMTDFCKELMLVNPYDHILETIGARGFNHTEYQSIEEFGSWA